MSEKYRPGAYASSSPRGYEDTSFMNSLQYNVRQCRVAFHPYNAPVSSTEEGVQTAHFDKTKLQHEGILGKHPICETVLDHIKKNWPKKHKEKSEWYMKLMRESNTVVLLTDVPWSEKNKQIWIMEMHLHTFDWEGDEEGKPTDERESPRNDDGDSEEMYVDI
jgi:hypothetical protein